MLLVVFGRFLGLWISWPRYRCCWLVDPSWTWQASFCLRSGMDLDCLSHPGGHWRSAYWLPCGRRGQRGFLWSCAGGLVSSILCSILIRSPAVSHWCLGLRLAWLQIYGLHLFRLMRKTSLPTMFFQELLTVTLAELFQRFFQIDSCIAFDRVPLKLPHLAQVPGLLRMLVDFS